MITYVFFIGIRITMINTEFYNNSEFLDSFRSSWWDWMGTDDHECILQGKRQIVSAGGDCM